MSSVAKLLIGLLAALAVGWIAHGPMGRGEAFVARLDAGAQEVVHEAEIPGVTVQLARDPLARTAILSGPADRFQREGQGSLPGLNERVLAVPGMGAIDWADAPTGGSTLPLVAEILLLGAAAFGLGLLIAWPFRTRRQRGSYLEE